MLRKLINSILDLFFPKTCLGCQKEGVFLCEKCLKKIEGFSPENKENNQCFFCKTPSWQGIVCPKCSQKFSLTRIIISSSYKDPVLKEAIKIFKYHYIKKLTKPLGKLLIRVLKTNSTISNTSTNSTVIIPLPLHKRKLRQRGFNQSELLAKEVADYFSLSLLTNCLQRIINTSPQVDIKDNKLRKANIKNAFRCVEPKLIKDKKIILIDDVITTGATLSETAKVLKKSGAKEIWGLVVAKG